jgi:hypothetical protein
MLGCKKFHLVGSEITWGSRGACDPVMRKRKGWVMTGDNLACVHARLNGVVFALRGEGLFLRLL